MIWFLTNLIKGFCEAIALTPRSFQIFLGKTLGRIWFFIVPIRRQIALDNIQKAFPNWDKKKVWEVGRKNFENYGCGFIEFFLLPALNEKKAAKLIVTEGFEYLDQAKKEGKGMFLLTLHLGSWELMSASSTVFKMNLNVITKKFKAKGLNQIWVNLRRDKGLKLISEEKSTFEILRAIRRNEPVGFILDQFMGPPVGSRVKYFGHETGAPAALALFADRTHAPVLPSYNIRLPDGRIKIIVEEAVPFVEQGSIDKNIAFMTQVYTSKIEDIVKKYPEQWLWIHRRWKPFRE